MYSSSVSGLWDVSFGVDDVVVIIVSVPAGVYRFSCPLCGDFIVGSAGSAVIDLLLCSGATRLRSIPSPAVGGPNLTEADAECFRLLLQSDESFDDLLGR